MCWRMLGAVVALAIALTAAAPAAEAVNPSRKKAMWGPLKRDGKSVFPIYRDLGVGIYQMSLRWADTARSKPARQRDPNDPAYTWSSDVDFAIREAKRHGMKVSLAVLGTPEWANDKKDERWVPKNPGAYGRFMAAASRRYPAVKHWMVWAEPSRRANFRPLPRYENTGPRAYAKILDAAYGALKKVSRRNKVIGGNTFTTGDVTPRQWVRAMKLPNGRRPRMDLYGHNPFTRREPNLRKPPLGYGYADFSDLDTLAKWVDRAFRKRNGKLRFFLSEWFAPTDHANHEFNFYVTRKTQARWLRSALRITRKWSRIYTLGWFSLYDDPHPDGRHRDEVHRGLLTYRGKKKRSYRVYRRG